MSEQELLRTALVLPPRARRVLCVWAAVPGLGEAWGETDGFTGWGVADWEGEGVTTTWMGPATAVLPPSPRFREEKR